MKTRTLLPYLVCLQAMLLAPGVPAAFGQAASAPSPKPDSPPLKPEELQQLLAPIALYPDALLTQALMASTYPLEIVQADRWTKANKLTGDALAKELEKKDWDPSVKSMVNFPDVLALMSEKLDVTIKIGDAFIEQQADVLNTVQILRNKAQANGNLKSNEQQNVTVAPAPAPDPQVVYTQAPPPQIITIQSPSPSVIYVPSYNPAVVYGAWPYPAYPPYPYYPPHPPGYVATAAISFGLGVAAGAAWGYAWGNSNWGHGDVDINVNRNNNFNTNIDRSKYQGDRNNTNIGNGNKWQHNPAHRDGVAYRDQATAQKFGGASSAKATQAREAYRGRADAGRQNLQQGGGAGGLQNRPSAGQLGGGAQNRPNTGQIGGGAQNRPNTGQVGGGAQNRPNSGQFGGAQNRPSAGQMPAARPSTGTRSGAFSGVNSGAADRSASQRGSASRGSSAAARPSGGGARAGGGGARAGGGARGGGRR